jgi:hypothetical protein
MLQRRAPADAEEAEIQYRTLEGRMVNRVIKDGRYVDALLPALVAR